MVCTAFTVETLLVFVYKLLTNSVAQPAAAPRYVPVADTFCTLIMVSQASYRKVSIKPHT